MFIVLRAVWFNLTPDNPYFVPDIYAGKLKILFAVSVVVATARSIIRLLPANWMLRQTPFRERTWPGIENRS
jgi:hypothetical protein